MKTVKEFPTELPEVLSRLTAIGAPSFQEEARAKWILAWLRERGLRSGICDAVGNVLVDLSGGSSRLRLLDAHIDTVFSYKKVAITRRGNLWSAPGIFDNTVSCAQLLCLADEIRKQNRPVPLLLSFTVGEEGAGNLRGIREVAKTQKSRLTDAIVFDLDLEVLTRVAVGSRRYALEWKGVGGHSWNDFGTPSAIHDAVQWLEKLRRAFPWRKGRQTFNVGTITGGAGVNVIADRVDAMLDVRSTDPTFLETFASWLRRQPMKGFHFTETGNRPAGSLPSQHPLVREVRNIHSSLGLQTSMQALSTNANALFEADIPAVSTGLARGGRIHTENEYLERDSLTSGMNKLRALARMTQS